ncbi:MAG: SsrA-binding protein SmpB [Planctomycetota bacterium]|jgi:SsrA-binding protein|nr:SsrA-binding protein SmpB [Planctomycetota bacterium]MSR40153.1 SsrA-binding protein SmpB [Planctomycetota bacterium]
MAKAGPQKDDKKTDKLVAQNRKARFEYEVLETYEAGLVLRGTEVKVLRQGKMTLEESYARIDGGELFLLGANIPEYTHGNLQNHEPKRRRKCLLHMREIRKMHQKSQVKGLALVPLQVYFGARGFAKVTIAVCRGRKLHDKREHLRKKDVRRELRGE